MTATSCAFCRAPRKSAACSGRSRKRCRTRACACCRCTASSSGAAQDAALAPAPAGQRKIVLATSIAETSLTIEGIRVVVDSGLRRYAEFDPATGMSRLVTGKVSQAAADQRRGRAGRLSEGVCYRLWSEGTHASLAAQTAPEILHADLAPLALELSCWGATDAAELDLARPAARRTARAGARFAAATRGDRRGGPDHIRTAAPWQQPEPTRGWRTCWSRDATWERRAWPAILRPS